MEQYITINLTQSIVPQIVRYLKTQVLLFFILLNLYLIKFFYQPKLPDF